MAQGPRPGACSECPNNTAHISNSTGKGAGEVARACCALVAAWPLLSISQRSPVRELRPTESVARKEYSNCSLAPWAPGLALPFPLPHRHWCPDPELGGSLFTSPTPTPLHPSPDHLGVPEVQSEQRELIQA